MRTRPKRWWGGLVALIVLLAPAAYADLQTTTSADTIVVEAPEFHLLFDENEGGDVTEFFNLTEDDTAPYTNKSSSSGLDNMRGMFQIGAWAGSSRPGSRGMDSGGTSTLQLLESTPARVRLRNNLDLGNGIILIRDFSVYSSGKLHMHLEVTSSETLWDFSENLVGASASFLAGRASKTEGVAILSDNDTLSDLLEVWYDDYDVDGQVPWNPDSWLSEQSYALFTARLAGFISTWKSADVPAGTYVSNQLVEFMRTDITTTGNEWQVYADDYRNPALLVVTSGLPWLEDGDEYSEAEGSYTLAMSPSGLLAFDMDGAGYARTRPSLKVKDYHSLDSAAFSVSRNGSPLVEGTDYVAAVKPFAEAWYFDGAAATRIGDGGESGLADEYLADPANDYALSGLGDGTALYLGSDVPFFGVNLRLSSAGSGGALAWEYWNGVAWTSLLVSAVDAGAGDMLADGAFRFTAGDVSGWSPRALDTGEEGFNGERDLYWIRAVPLGNYLTAPVINEARSDLMLVHFLVDFSDDDQVEIDGPGSCPAPSEVDGMVLDRAVAGIAMSWEASADPCHDQYRVYASSSAAGWGPDWSPVSDGDGDPTDESWSYAPAASTLEFFLVVDVQEDGTEGPAGHYGR